MQSNVLKRSILHPGDSWYAEVRRRWAGAAEWVSGEGRFALLEHCRTLTIQLYESQWSALVVRNQINDAECGEGCLGLHEVIDLATDYR
jgi:hypothetical protein